VAQALGNPRVAALNLTVNVAVRAGLLDNDGFQGDYSDRFIYASARAWDARLATKDPARERLTRCCRSGIEPRSSGRFDQTSVWRTGSGDGSGAGGGSGTGTSGPRAPAAISTAHA